MTPILAYTLRYSRVLEGECVMNEKIVLVPRSTTIDGVLMNSIEMYGVLQRIAGSFAIVHIDTLELPYDEDERD